MATKKIPVKNATLKFPTGQISHIGKFIPGLLNTSTLPLKDLVIQDPETQEVFRVDLVDVVPFTQDYIPEILAQLSYSMDSVALSEKLKQELNISSNNQLAFYLYHGRERIDVH